MATSHPFGPLSATLRPESALTVAVLGAAALFASTQAVARDYTTRDVGGWTVAASRDGEGCFVTREFDRTGHTTLLLGLEVDGTNHLTVLNANWSIEPKERLELTFRLAKGSFPKHFAVGLASAGKQGFVTNFGAKFPNLFAASPSLDIFRGDVPVERLNLTGSGAAVAELRRCVEAQREKPAGKAAAEERSSGSIPLDPFAGGSGRKLRW
ncbi:hypothetical protein LK533_13145 [Sphingomonas sp. PL-96]|uniref:hypothetical protein n=1 Tax=Sphingomonas sp. PL-96 TaxID=2887201 RepID=UPI001E498C92|nr:hypothetical protein [Sphingomonas sp. PL-96]MCC2977618.1 hypothetical protein [Sphingomonas sp. PL-96]